METNELELKNDSQAKGDLAASDEAGHEKWKQMSSEKEAEYNERDKMKESKPKDWPEDAMALLAPTRAVVQADEIDGPQLPKSPQKEVLETDELHNFVGSADSVTRLSPKANEVSVVVPPGVLLPPSEPVTVKVNNKGKEKIAENRGVGESSSPAAKRSRVETTSSTAGLKSNFQGHMSRPNQSDLFSDHISKWPMS